MAAAAAAAAAGAFSPSANAAPVTWALTGGGDFNTAANWNPAAVPTVADTAIFEDNAGGTISLSAPANPLQLSFRRTVTDVVTIDAAGSTLSLGNTTTGGGIILGTAAGQVNRVVLTGGTFAATHATAGALFQVGNFAGSNGNVLTFTGAAAQLTSPSTAGAIGAIGVAGSNDNTLRVENGATVNVRGTVNVGVIGATPSTGNAVVVNNGTFSLPGGSRGINLRNGSLLLDGSYSDLGFLDADDAGNNTTITFNSGQLYSRRTQVDNGRDFVVGTANAADPTATFGLAYSGGTMTIGNDAADDSDLVINASGRLVGSGTITIAGTGRLRGVAGGQVRPSIVSNPALTTDDRPTGTLNVNGLWDNAGLEVVLDVGDFPAGAANLPNPFTPLDFVNVFGTFAHGGTVTFDVTGYVQPEVPAEFKVVGWNAESGSSASTAVQFAGGPALPFRFASDGLYLTVPEPAGAAISVGAALLLARRRSTQTESGS